MINNILDNLKYIAQKDYNVNEDIRLYLFGSFLNCKKGLTDIDLLVVYKSRKNLQKLKMDLEYLELKYPFDITILSEIEEIELDFINIVNAKRIY